MKGDAVYLVKTCPRHGLFETPVWRGSPVFDQWRREKISTRAPVLFKDADSGCPYDCGLCPGHRQRSCTVIIEVTQRCDLSCPVCYAGAPSKVPDPSAAAISQLFCRAAKAGPGSNIQLSGGEPTLRDDLPDLVAMGRNAGFDFIQINTNGLRLGRDPSFVKALKQAGLASVFMQFDGIGDDVHRRLRGRDLKAAKCAAIETCGQHGIGVVLVPTLVPGVNTHCIGDILDAALSWAPVVRGVHFQPISYFGRYGDTPNGAGRITLPEVMRAIEAQSCGRFQTAHLGPPGCENALCSFNGRFLQLADGTIVPLKPSGLEACCTPVKAEEGAARAMAAVARQWNGPQGASVETVSHDRSGCRTDAHTPVRGDAAAPMSLDAFIDRARSHTFSISAMAFQDAWTIALDRVRDCCIHVMAPNGNLVPFCLYNLTAVNGRRLYRQ
jgi:uncharacterized radical SAM superfamily Fe-S cluster-containing enzyme